MRLNFLVNHIVGGWEPTDIRLGGTERGIQEWAEELVRKGHEVYVFRNGHKNSGMQVHGGVIYQERSTYHGHGDICINVKSPEQVPLEPTIFYTNNTDADQLDLSKYSAVIQISEWAKDNISVNNPKVYVVPHGYEPLKIYPETKIKNQCLYASSPDRGLETLLRIWPKVIAAHPDATLKVTYGAPEYDVEGVEFLGNVDEETMNQLYRESDYWTYPCNGGELQCITGMKAQAAGCIPVIIPVMALQETVKNGYFATADNYAEVLIDAMSKDNTEIQDALVMEHYPTIEESTNRLLEIIKQVLH